MKILVSGGTGFVGTSLVGRLLERGHTLTVTSSSGRSSFPGNQALSILQADTSKPGDWQNEVAAFDVIVNLAGRSIFHLWTRSYMDVMYASRVNTTKNIVDALPNRSNTVLISTSAAGYYGDGGERENDERSPPGHDFLAGLCRDWEREAMQAATKGCRVAVMRFGVVLGKSGGAIATMKTPFLLGLGGPIGNGQQWFPWIHIKDVIEAVLFLIDGSDLEGPFNFTAPGVLRQQEFARLLARQLRRPAFFPAPGFVMKTLLGELGQSLLQGQKVVPKALQDRGFVFAYPELVGALEEILRG
jgi:hypothetical protein